MDGGVRQEEMAKQLKRQVKENRRGERISGHSYSPLDAELATSTFQNTFKELPAPIDLATADIHVAGVKPCPELSNIWLQSGTDPKPPCEHNPQSVPFGQSDTVLIMFYLEHLLPFLFPFYQPSLLEGGRAWILEMIIGSPVVRQATLCQSSYFFSLVRGIAERDAVWESVLAQTKNAFGLLKQSLQVLDGSNIKGYLQGAVRVMASIIHMQRFEIAILSFDNCRAHLSAALALFRQLLDSLGAVEPAGSRSNFNAVLSRLGPGSWILPSLQVTQLPSAEQVAFRFSSALLILDDLIASTVSQEQPTLYEYHRGLLCNTDVGGTEPPVNIEAVIGCQNWVLLYIGEVAMLDAWKQRRKRAGNLDVMELVHRAKVIKDSLEDHLTELESNAVITPQAGRCLVELFQSDFYHKSETSVSQTSLVTRIWGHAALIYLFIVVSGWQPASADVHHHVTRILELITQVSPPELLRTMVWPFCVAGCIAEPAHETQFRALADSLQPPSLFGTVRKALEIMENVWLNRNAKDAESRDLATCFRSQGSLVLLV